LFCHLHVNFLEEASWLVAKQVVAATAGPDLESGNDGNFEDEKDSQIFLAGNLH